MTTTEDNFAFVQNLLNVKHPLPFELAPNHFFRKANEIELPRIRAFLERSPAHRDPGIPYEFDLPLEKHSPTSGTIRWLPLARPDWRYYVIAYQGQGGETMYDLRMAGCLSTKELRSDLQFHGGGFGMSSSAVFSDLYYKHYTMTGSVVIEEADLIETRSIYEGIKRIEQPFPEIIRAIRMFLSLDAITEHPDLKTLGLFSVIEAIITHRPKSTETGDSLTHQVRTKIPLLSRRFSTSIKYSDFFGKASEDTLWSKLYDYRSCIAHGDITDFRVKLSVLKSPLPVQTFLRDITKTLLRHALKEPELYMDLRKC
jgi:hypothetical protein